MAGADFLCEFKGAKEPLKTNEGVFYAVKIKNKMLIGDEVEIITPHEQFKTKLLSVKDENGIDLPLANTNDDVFLLFDKQPQDYKYALARTIGVKNNVS